MKQVTRNIDFDSAKDLLERVPRACLSYSSDHGPQVQPVRLLWQDGRYLIRIAKDIITQPVPGQEMVLLVDEGIYYFELRAIYIRGRMLPAEVPTGGLDDFNWFEVMPIKIIAWDYGNMREVGDES